MINVTNINMCHAKIMPITTYQSRENHGQKAHFEPRPSTATANPDWFPRNLITENSYTDFVIWWALRGLPRGRQFVYWSRSILSISCDCSWKCWYILGSYTQSSKSRINHAFKINTQDQSQSNKQISTHKIQDFIPTSSTFEYLSSI